MSHEIATKKARKEIRYLNKNFDQFRQSLIDFAKVYFPNTFNDFNESDPGVMFIELASYVGDVLSYYIDSQLKESLITTAEEKESIIQLSQALGYQPRASVGSVVDLDVYQLLPATGTGTNTRPDWRFAQLIKLGMSVKAAEGTGQIFRTLDDIDFNSSSSLDPTDLTVYSVDNDGIPIYYLLKKRVLSRAGEQKETTFTFTSPQKFTRELIPDTNIISIDEIKDSDNNIWYEVDFLAQDTIFQKFRNIASNGSTQLANKSTDVPFLLKAIRVPRRFIKRLNSKNQYELRFGAGVSSDPDTVIVPSPFNIGAGIGVSSLQKSWDPSNFLLTDAYGQAPQNTTLTVKYTVGGGVESNVNAGTLTRIVGLEFVRNMDLLDQGLVNTVKQSIACNNSKPASGGMNDEPVETIRQNALANFRSQNRVVTKEDYEFRCLTMPSHLGSIAKAFASAEGVYAGQCDDNKDQIDKLKKELEQCQVDNNNLNNSVTMLQQALANCSSTQTVQVDELKKELAQCQADNISLNNTITMFQKALSDCQAGVEVRKDISPFDPLNPFGGGGKDASNPFETVETRKIMGVERPI